MTNVAATLDDLRHVAENGKAELIKGELVLMSSTGGLPGYAAGEIFASGTQVIAYRRGEQAAAGWPWAVFFRLSGVTRAIQESTAQRPAQERSPKPTDGLVCTTIAPIRRTLPQLSPVQALPPPVAL